MARELEERELTSEGPRRSGTAPREGGSHYAEQDRYEHNETDN